MRATEGIHHSDGLSKQHDELSLLGALSYCTAVVVEYVVNLVHAACESANLKKGEAHPVIMLQLTCLLFSYTLL